MNKQIVVGFLSVEDPHDRRPQSGTNFMVRKALEDAGLKVVWLTMRIGATHRLMLYVVSFIQKVFRITIPGYRSRWSASLLTRSVDMDLASKCDILFCPFTQPVGRLLPKPYVYMSDAVFAQMINYYWFDHLPKRVVNEGNRLQKQVLEDAAHIVVSSDWAARAVIDEYGIDAHKVSVVEFGANIDDKAIMPQTHVYQKQLDVLFLGVDWQRKGGDIAVEACRWLNENGIATTLHVVGPKELDANIQNLEFVDYVGFLNKNHPDQYARLAEVISKCHCLLLPTMAECSAIAFSESSAYGIPIFSHVTGGVPNYVRDGVNGYLLPIGATGRDFGEIIKRCIETGEMQRMSVTAKELYASTLNWNVWGQRVRAIITEILNGKD